MKSLNQLFLSCILTLTTFVLGAQSPQMDWSGEFEGTWSLTGSQILDPGFEDVIVFWVRSGVTTYKQTSYLIGVDRETLEEVNRVSVMGDPDMKSLWGQAYAGDKCIYFPTYVYDKKSKETTVYCYKLDSSFELDTAPKKCFTGPSPDREGSFAVRQNSNKEFLVFSYHKRDKKAKVDQLHYYVMNNDFELINSNVIERHYKTEEPGGGYFVYDNGVVYTNPSEPSVLNIVDFKDHKEYKIRNSAEMPLRCSEVEVTASGELYVAGSYLELGEKARKVEGLFMAYIDLKNEKLAHFETMPLENVADQVHLSVSHVEFTDDGAAYYMTSVYRPELEPAQRNTFQLYYMDQRGRNWRKDLPIPAQTLSAAYFAQNLHPRVGLIDNNICILYNDTEKGLEVDLDNFEWKGRNDLGLLNLGRPGGNSLSVLTINQNGVMSKVNQQVDHGQFFNGEYEVGENVVYSPIRYVKGMVFRDSSIMAVRFK